MTRIEWITVLSKARELANGKNDTCYQMFGFLLEAIKSLPVRKYRCEEEYPEEECDE